MKNKLIYTNIFHSIVNTYSQIFFSDNKVFGIFLLIITFVNPFAGLSGLIALLSSNFFAYILNLNKHKIISGVYGYNPLMVGLGIGLYFKFSLVLLVILVISALYTLLLNLSFEGILQKYGLPFLSLPFLIAIWTFTLAYNELKSLGLSESGIYILNDLYNIGGNTMVNLYETINHLGIPEVIKTYFLSLGAIFFQFNFISGIVIAIGLFFVSRISFLLSVFGYFAAYLFYLMIGSDISSVSYINIGFNYILTSIAIGGFFLIPSKKTFAWVMLLIPLVAILTISLTKLFSVVGLTIFSLPFNIVVLMFLYSLKLRTRFDENLTEVVVQQNSPEKNLYSYINFRKRFKNIHNFVPVKLPFWGEWTVTQGHDGEYTHKDDWKYAWDFEILDSEGKTYKDSGTKVEDYYCYDKAVLSPVNGYVVQIDDGIPDNKIGEVNTKKNWGNTIVIKYSDYFYAKLSHLKAGSFKVEVGDYVKQGQIIASSGNSGRSPYPHLHFQLQATPYIGSKTLEYPISYYLNFKGKDFTFHQFEIPKKNDVVANIEINELLKNAYKFTSGKKILYTSASENNELGIITGEWIVNTDIYNNSYIYCKKTNSYAYFSQNEDFFYFNNFKGNKNSLLYYFFLANFKVGFGFYKNLEITDSINPQTVFSKTKLFIQDFVAMFYIYLKAKFTLKYIKLDSDFSTSTAELISIVKLSDKEFASFNIQINEDGINKIIISKQGKSQEFILN